MQNQSIQSKSVVDKIKHLPPLTVTFKLQTWYLKNIYISMYIYKNDIVYEIN